MAADGEIARESIRASSARSGEPTSSPPITRTRRPSAAPPGPDLGVDRPGQRALLAAHALLPGTLHLSARLSRGPCRRPRAGFYFLTQMLLHALHAGYTCVEVGLTHVDRTAGRSKAVSAKNILKALQTIAQAWWAIRLTGSSVARRPNDGVEPTGGARDRRGRLRRRRAGTQAARPGLPGPRARPVAVRRGRAAGAPDSRGRQGRHARRATSGGLPGTWTP